MVLVSDAQIAGVEPLSGEQKDAILEEARTAKVSGAAKAIEVLASILLPRQHPTIHIQPIVRGMPRPLPSGHRVQEVRRDRNQAEAGPARQTSGEKGIVAQPAEQRQGGHGREGCCQARASVGQGSDGREN